MDATLFAVLSLIIIACESCFDNEKNAPCVGKRFENVSLTAYYPNYEDEDQEDGMYDKKKKKLRTLQDYLDDRADYVTLSMDEAIGVPYGTRVCIPELNEHFGHNLRIQVRDSSMDLYGKGYSRADICVRSEMDSYDITLNRKVTLVFEK